MTPDSRHGAPVNGVQVPTPSEGCGGRTVPSAHVRCRTWSVGSGKSHRAHSTNRKRSHCGRIVSNQPLLIGTVDAVPHKRVHGGGARLRMLLPLVQDGRPVPGGCRPVECGPVRLLAGPILLGAGPPPFYASTQWLGHDTGATINESIAGRVAIRLVSIPVLLGIIRSARQQHIHMIQNAHLARARVVSHSGTTNMRLA